jgi:Zn-dependent protease with chaperone function
MAFFEGLIGIVALVCAVWVIYDVLAKNKGLSQTAKIVWIVCAILFSIITTIIYFLFGRKK